MKKRTILEEMAYLVNDLKEEVRARAYAEKIEDAYLKCCAFSMLYALSAKKPDIDVAHQYLALIKDKGYDAEHIAAAGSCIKKSENFVQEKHDPVSTMISDTIKEFAPFLFLK